MKRFVVSSLFIMSVASFGCRSAGPYGYAAKYEPASDEAAAIAGAREFDPVMSERKPDEWRKTNVVLFGVVTNRAPGSGGAASLTLSLRKLEPRNLCTNANDEDTCRVTVSDREFGVVHVLVPLRPEDDMGGQAIGIGSLVRIVGRLGDDVDASDGGPIVRASYYRHWPRNFYVTRSAADTMRQ